MIKKCKTGRLALILTILTLTLGRFVALEIEKRSFQTVTEPSKNSPSLFEVRYSLYEDDLGLRTFFTPALKVTKVDYSYPCPNSKNNGLMVEFRFLTYWGIPTPWYAHTICGEDRYGKVPRCE